MADNCVTCGADLAGFRERNLAHECDLSDAVMKAREYFTLLQLVAEDAMTEGCDGLATISIWTLNEVRAVLGRDPIDTDGDRR